MNQLLLRTVDCESDLDLCRRFTADAYVYSFGDASRMEPDGWDWNAWFKSKVAACPDGCVLALCDGQPVGYLLIEVLRAENLGRLHLIYVVPELRGSGVAEALHTRAIDVFSRDKLDRATLNVSSTNARAMQFYRKRSWLDLGPRPGHEYVNVMQRAVG